MNEAQRDALVLLIRAIANDEVRSAMHQPAPRGIVEDAQCSFDWAFDLPYTPLCRRCNGSGRIVNNANDACIPCEGCQS